MKTIKIFAFILLMLPLAGMAQKYNITGMLVDTEQGKMLVGAHVVATDANKKRFSAVSDGRGMFELKNVSSGKYEITVSYIGLAEFKKEVFVGHKNVDLGVLKLNEKPEAIIEIDIVANMPRATMVGDTTQFNASAFKTNPDASAEDMIQKIPGIVVQSGTVQAQGESVEEITVDGKPFFGKNPTATLQTLPAEVIDKIQIFDKQSEQSQFTGFNDGQTSKTINIITKENMRNSTFGKIYSGYGTDNRYSLGGNLNFFKDNRRISIIGLVNNVNQQNFTSEDLLGVSSSQNGGASGGGGQQKSGRAGSTGSSPPSSGGSSSFMVDQDGGISKTQSYGLNFSDSWGKKIEVSGSYFFNHSTNDNNSELTRSYISESDSGLVYNEKTESSTENSNHRLNLKFEYDINDNNSLMVRPSLSIQQNEGSSLSLTENTQNLSFLNSASNLYSTDLTGLNFSNDLLFRHKFAKTGRTLSWMFYSQNSHNKGDSKLMVESLNSSGLSAITNQAGTLDKNNWTLSSNLVYTEPIGSKSLLSFSYNTSYQDNSITSETSDFDSLANAYSTLNPALSNTSDNGYLSHQMGTGYMFRSGILMFNADLGYQLSNLTSTQIYPSEVDMDKNYGNFMPRMMMMLNFSRTQRLMLGYRAQTDNPSIEQLSDVVDNSDPYQLSKGNPNLGQSYQHNLFMRYSLLSPDRTKVFYFMLMGDYANDYIADNIFSSPTDTMLSNGILLPVGGQISQPENMDGYVRLNSFATFGMPVYFLSSNLNLNLSGSFTRKPGIYNSIAYNTETKTAGAGLVLSSNISEYIDFTLSSTSNFSQSLTDLFTDGSSNYFNQESKLRLHLLSPSGLHFESDVAHQYYSGLSEGYNENYFLWNVGMGKKFLKNKSGELRLTVFDILNQNQSIKRTVNDVYIEDSKTQVLQRYFMVSFIYTIRNLKNTNNDEFKG